MTNPPRTLEEARERRYGEWAGQPEGLPFFEGWCAHTVFSAWPSIGYQCSRNPGHGPADLYCKQHAKMLERRKG